MLRAMPATTAFPTALRHPTGRVGKPAMVAALGPSGALVAAGQYGVAVTVATFDADLTNPIARALGGPEVDYHLSAATALPDGRFLLCARTRPAWYVDGRTPAVTPADAVAGVGPSNDWNSSFASPWPRDAFVLGDRLLLGHGSHFSNIDQFQLFTELPMAGGPGTPWLRDLEHQVRAMARIVAHWYVSRAAVLGDGLIAAGQNVQGSGSHGHALQRLGADKLRAHRPWPRERVRDPALALAADGRHGVVYAYAKGALEVVDEQLATVAEVTGHPFLASHRLLAGDGRGRLLWYAGRTRTLMLTDPDELDPVALETSLDTLAAAARPQRRKR